MEEILERVEGNPNYYVLRRYVESIWWNHVERWMYLNKQVPPEELQKLEEDLQDIEHILGSIDPEVPAKEKFERKKEGEVKSPYEILAERINEEIEKRGGTTLVLPKEGLIWPWRSPYVFHVLKVVEGRYKYVISTRRKLILTNERSVMELYNRKSKRRRMYEFENGRWVKKL